MLFFSHHKKCVALFMAMVFLVTLMSSFAPAHGTGVVYGTNLSAAVGESIPPVTDRTDMGDFKPPKYSFVDYDAFFSCAGFMPLSQQAVPHPGVDIGFGVVPGIWPEILIPPKI